MKSIVTLPPYTHYVKDVLGHPNLSGFRLNTVMPTAGETLGQMLARVKKSVGNYPLWVDLKTRQLRVSGGLIRHNKAQKPFLLEIGDKTGIFDPAVVAEDTRYLAPPWTELFLDHEIELDTSGPVKCYFGGHGDWCYVAAVEGNRLILLDGPHTNVAQGGSINITHPSLKIKGYFTEKDLEYIEASKKQGLHDYMLSYVENWDDIETLLKIDPEANILAKIESEKGYHNAPLLKSKIGEKFHLMLGCGDAYIEAPKPHHILEWIKRIVQIDPQAVIASRLCESFAKGPYPSFQDILALGYLKQLGTHRIMLGDELCFNGEAVLCALNLVHSVSS